MHATSEALSPRRSISPSLCFGTRLRFLPCRPVSPVAASCPAHGPTYSAQLPAALFFLPATRTYRSSFRPLAWSSRQIQVSPRAIRRGVHANRRQREFNNDHYHNLDTAPRTVYTSHSTFIYHCIHITIGYLATGTQCAGISPQVNVARSALAGHFLSCFRQRSGQIWLFLRKWWGNREEQTTMGRVFYKLNDQL